MAVFLRYLAVMLAQLVWQRLRGRAPVPPIRLPRNPIGSTSVVSPWQALLVLWLANKAWSKYGHGIKGQMQQQVKQGVKNQVKHRLKDARQSASQRFDAWLYAPSKFSTRASTTTISTLSGTPGATATVPSAPQQKSRLL